MSTSIKEKMFSALTTEASAPSSIDDIVTVCASVAEREALEAYMHGREMGKRNTER